MGERQNRLATILKASTGDGLPKVRHAALLASQAAVEAWQIYQTLGGVQSAIPAFPALSWDMVLDGVAIELDEEQHFNRYRATTLMSPAYAATTGFRLESYRAWCHDDEPDALARHKQGAGFWSNVSTERQFGPSSPRGELANAGSSRYKQRAYYDFLRDLAPWIVGTPIARISVWEVLPGSVGNDLTIGSALLRPGPTTDAAVFDLVIARMRDVRNAPLTTFPRRHRHEP